MARGGKCPMCEKQRVLERLRTYSDIGIMIYVYLCTECKTKLLSVPVEPFDENKKRGGISF